MAPYQHTYESRHTNQKKKDRLSAFLANFGETGRVLKALLALAKRQPNAASSPSPTRCSQPRFRTSRPYLSRRTHFHHFPVRYLNVLQIQTACARQPNRTRRCGRTGPLVEQKVATLFGACEAPAKHRTPHDNPQHAHDAKTSDATGICQPCDV